MKSFAIGLLGLLMIPSAAGATGAVRGLDHVAVTVPELEPARDFFEKGLGCVTVFDLGPFKDDAGTWMADHIGTHPRAEMKIAVMKCGNASTIELMDIKSPSQDPEIPMRDDVGSASLGFYTDDLEASIKRIEAAGGKALGGITDVTGGPEEGRRFIYTVSPWGQMVFLLNDGTGIAYGAQENDVDLFSPGNLPAN